MRVVFGPGALGALPDVLRDIGARRVLVVTTSGRAVEQSTVTQALGATPARVCSIVAVVHVPVTVVQAALEVSARCDADAVLALGGGSAIGARQGDGVGERPTCDRRAHHVLGLRDDGHLGHHRCRGQAHRPRSTRGATGGAVRAVAHRLPVTRSQRGERDERHRPLRRGALRRGGDTPSRRCWPKQACEPWPGACPTSCAIQPPSRRAATRSWAAISPGARWI